jgi:hypothetical protein
MNYRDSNGRTKLGRCDDYMKKERSELRALQEKISEIDGEMCRSSERRTHYISYEISQDTRNKMIADAEKELAAPRQPYSVPGGYALAVSYSLEALQVAKHIGMALSIRKKFVDGDLFSQL